MIVFTTEKQIVLLYKATRDGFTGKDFQLKLLRERRGMGDNFRCERECVWRIHK